MGNNVMSKIARLSKESKLELKSEKVELGIAQDVEKLGNKLKAAEDSLGNIEDKAVAAGKKYEAAQLKAYNNVLGDQDKLFSQLDKLVGVNKDAKELLSKAEKAAKDLGVNVNDIKGIKELRELSSGYAGLYNGVRITIGKIDSITI